MDGRKKRKKPVISLVEKPQDRRKAIEATMAPVERIHGQGALMYLGQRPMTDVPVVPTGSLMLDTALSIHGLPRGRVVEVFGSEGTGKTTIALSLIAEAQKLGDTCTFIDVEHALNDRYAQALGVDVDGLLISQPDSGEQALSIAETLVRSASIGVVVVDSVAALLPIAELEGDLNEPVIGAQAKLMSAALRRLTAAVSKSGTILIFINQLRQSIGVEFGSGETTPGGKALKFYASVRLDARKINNIRDGDNLVGHRLKIRVMKNKMAPPFRNAEVDLFYRKGFSREGELIDLGLLTEVVEQAGSYFSFKGSLLTTVSEK